MRSGPMKTTGLHNPIANAQPRMANTALTTLTLLLALVVVTPAAQAQSYSVLHTFVNPGSAGTPGDGGYPSGGVIMRADGSLYGTTSSGGQGYGTIFKITASGTYSVIHSFNLADGSGPQGTLVSDAAGNLYGITAAGGPVGSTGTVFKIDTSDVFSVLSGVPAQSRAGLTIDAAGNLYGTTFVGGTGGFIPGNSGTVFKLDTSLNFSVLHNFGDVDDGVNPTARLYLEAGYLYGTTENGGTGAPGNPNSAVGTVFKLDTSGNNYSVIHNFVGGTDGAQPEAGVIGDGAGNLYGTTFNGGTGVGTIFKLGASGSTYSVLHNFTGPGNSGPAGDLVRDSAGNLYGTTTGGGSGSGTIFELNPAGAQTVLYAFNGASDGSRPVAGLFSSGAGTFFGTTFLGGSATAPAVAAGTVFKLTVPVAPPPTQLNNFTAQVLVSNFLRSTAVAGQFNSTSTVDPVTQAVSVSVAGTSSFSVTFAPGAFKKVFGVYVANVNSGSTRTSMLLVPLGNGNWSYSATIAGFVPRATSVTVSLTIGAETGTATVNALVF